MINRIGLRSVVARALALTLIVSTAPILASSLAENVDQVAADASALAQKSDVASIKRCKPGTVVEPPSVGGGGPSPSASSSFGLRTTSPGRLSVECANLADLIGMSVSQTDPLLSGLSGDSRGRKFRGGPAWLYSSADSDRYRSETTVSFPADRKALLGSMLRALLEERFHLRMHQEVEDRPVDAMVVAKSGLKLSPANDGDCTPFDPTPDVLSTGLGEKLVCGTSMSAFKGPNSSLALSGPLGRFAGMLSGDGVLDRPVVDKTGTSVDFNVYLEYARDESARGAGPSIFTALKQQRGLRLQPTKGPRGFIVIDHVERPSEN